MSLIEELLEIERPRWAEIRVGIPAWHPRCDGEGDGGGEGGEGHRRR